MRTGIIISGAAHLLFLLFLLIGPFAFRPEPVEIVPVTEVSLMSNAEFEAQISSVPDVPVTAMAPMAMPTAEANDATAPEADTPPEQTVQDVTEAPSERDSDPDLSALERLAQPEVSVFAPQPVSPVVGTGTTGNSPTASLNAPPTPRAAPRIGSIAAPPPPDEARSSDRVVEATAPGDTAPTPVEEQVAEAPPESVTQIEPDARPDAPPSAAPPRASVPVRRPTNAAANAEEIARKIREEEEAAIQAALEAVTAAPVEAPAAPQAAPNLTGAQKRGIGAVIADKWNKTIVLGKENYERLVVRIAVDVGPDGTIIGDVEPIDPASPTGDFAVAYETARRAVLGAGKIPLPEGQFPDGVRLILRFDPLQGIGLN